MIRENSLTIRGNSSKEKMNKKLAIISASALVLLALPIATFAIPNPGVPQGNASLNAIQIVNKVLDFVWPLFIGFAVIMLLVAGFVFLSANGDPGKVGTARMAILWAAVGIVVGLLAFSIPYVISNTICAGASC